MAPCACGSRLDQKTVCDCPSFFVPHLLCSQHLQSHQSALACSSEVYPWCAIWIHMHYRGLVSLEVHFATRELFQFHNDHRGLASPFVLGDSWCIAGSSAGVMYNAAPSFPAAAVGAVCGCHAVITSNTEQHTKVGDCMREDDTMGKQPKKCHFSSTQGR
jgi:hypothetical protein